MNSPTAPQPVTPHQSYVTDPNKPSPGTASQEECLQKINPWPKVNDLFESRLEVLYYKRAMVLGLMIFTAAAFGFILESVCEFINFAAFLHLIPVLLPLCNRTLHVMLWIFISVASIALTVVSVFLGLAADCAAASAIMLAIILPLEGLLIFHFQLLDPRLKDKLRECFRDCGCGVKEAEVRAQEEERIASTRSLRSMQGMEAGVNNHDTLRSHNTQGGVQQYGTARSNASQPQQYDTMRSQQTQQFGTLRSTNDQPQNVVEQGVQQYNTMRSVQSTMNQVQQAMPNSPRQQAPYDPLQGPPVKPQPPQLPSTLRNSFSNV